MPGRLAAVVATILMLTLPSTADAQGTTTNPFGLPSAPPVTPTATTPTVITAPSTTSTSGGGLTSGSVAAISIGALVLLGGISFFIWYDARRRAPVRHRMATAAAGSGSRPGSKRVKPRKLSPAERRRRKRGRAK